MLHIAGVMVAVKRIRRAELMFLAFDYGDSSRMIPLGGALAACRVGNRELALSLLDFISNFNLLLCF